MIEKESMKIEHHISLQPFNTFGIHVAAERMARIESVETLQAFVREHQAELAAQPPFILGGGSNVLLMDKLQRWVIKVEIFGKRVVQETDNEVFLTVGAGENWHELVRWTLERDFYGLENLSLIPGTVGAAPIQNIGAYGVELKDVFEHLEAVELATGNLKTFAAKDCAFGYRDSIFKKSLKGKYCIAKVTFRLSKQVRLNMKYGAIRQKLLETGKPENEWTPKMVSDVVMAIRSSKLPDPKEIGNAGSFFKNPTIPRQQLEALKVQFPDIVFYELPNDMVKVPAGWLIERAGWKGRRVGNTGMYRFQSLVLVNHGAATGKEVYEHSERVLKSVEAQFGIRLSREVNVIAS